MTPVRGMSLVDVVVGTGIMLVVFLSIFGAYKIAIDLVLNTKARIGGMALVSQQLEYLRGLPYTSLGTVGGIPSGLIPQTATTTLNGIAYSTRTLILYVDDPADGLLGADSNGITADYKELKVVTTWTVHQKSYSTFAVTRVSPHGIESLSNGGTLRVNTFDALAAPVAGATVHITNASTTPTVDVTVTTDSGGSVAFPGAPAASNYKISVSKDSYSSAQTYDISVANPNPNPGHVSVANHQTTTASFAIDRLGTLTVKTFSPINTGSFQDDFTNSTNLAATTSVTVVGSALQLLDPGTGYLTTGSARSTSVTPAQLATWDSASWHASTSASVTAAVQVMYQNAGVWTPVPNSAVPGNSAGLTGGSVSLAGVSTSTYPTLALAALFTSSNASTTPSILDWRVDYHAGPSPLPNIGFSIYGNKTIGTTISGAPIRKFAQTLTTSAAGTYLITPVEWDSYTIALTGSSYDVAEQCPSPLSVQPLQDQTASLTLVPHTANSLRVVVTGSNAPLAGATVALTAPGNQTLTSSSCGQTFFSGLAVSGYTLTVSKTGYQTVTQNISVAGASVITVPLTP